MRDETLDNKIGRMYYNGATDVVISKMLNIKKTQVISWRRRFKLSANPAKRDVTSHDYKHIKILYNSGYNDMEIAKISDFSTGRIRHWRNVNNLPANDVRRKQLDEANMFELYYLGLPDPYIARMCGTCANCVQDWRRSNNLPIIPRKQSYKVLERFDNIPEKHIFDDESLFYNDDFINKFASGEITNG